MTKNGIDYVIAYGTALGYKRHNGTYIPWDDDTDLLIHHEDTQRARALITDPYCTHNFWGGWKIFPCDGPHAGKYPWKYPFFDVFDNVHLKNKKNKENSAESIMFPSKSIVFEGLDIRGPNDIDEHLRRKYGDIYKCVSPHWDHRHEMGLKKRACHARR